MADFDPGQMTPMELARLHRQWLDDTLMKAQSCPFHSRGGLIGMAASVLIISLAWIGQPTTRPTRISSNSPHPLPEWQRLALGEPLQAPFIRDESTCSHPRDGGR